MICIENRFALVEGGLYLRQPPNRVSLFHTQLFGFGGLDANRKQNKSKDTNSLTLDFNKMADWFSYTTL